MSHFGHFFTLVCEYSLLPIVLFLMVFFSRKKGTQDEDQLHITSKLAADGYEFVLIEAFAHLSLFLRIFFSPEKTQDPTNGFMIAAIYITIITFVGLLGVFLAGVLLRRGIVTDTINSFRVTFYSSFASWWFRIVSLSFFSGLIRGDNWKLPSILILIICGVCVYFFRKIVYKYFIRWDILFLKFTLLRNQEKHSQAQKLGWKIYKMVKGKQSQTEYVALSEIISNLALCYHKEKNLHKIRTEKILGAFEDFLSKGETAPYKRLAHYQILGGLYCLIGQKEKALKLVTQTDMFDEDDKVEFIKYVTDGDCDKIFAE